MYCKWTILRCEDQSKKQFFLKLNFANASNADVYPGIFYGDVIIPAPTTTRRGGGGSRAEKPLIGWTQRDWEAGSDDLVVVSNVRWTSKQTCKNYRKIQRKERKKERNSWMSKFFEIFFVDFVYPNLHPGLTRLVWISLPCMYSVN